jgi:hypothetical protein
MAGGGSGRTCHAHRALGLIAVVKDHQWIRKVYTPSDSLENLVWWLCVRCRCREWSVIAPSPSENLGGLWLQQGTSPERTMARTPVDCDEALVKWIMES